MSKHFKVVGLFSVLCLAVIMTACGGPARAEEKSTEAVNVTHPSRIIIENFNGRVDITTDAVGKAAVEVTKFADINSRDSLQNIEFGISQDSQTVIIRAQWPEGKASIGNAGADLKVHVPADCIVQAAIGNGQITYRGGLNHGDYAFAVGNGTIELTLPAASQFALKASVGNGGIHTDFPVAGATPNARVVTGRVGTDPAASIAAFTGNGEINIRRGN